MFCPRVVYLRVHQVSVAVFQKKKKKQCGVKTQQNVGVLNGLGYFHDLICT